MGPPQSLPEVMLAVLVSICCQAPADVLGLQAFTV
jgi:hypothetical protein